MTVLTVLTFFFSSRRRHTRSLCDWSSDVCSSDLTDELFPVWRYHPFFTNSLESTVAADITHRRHAIIETVFADLIDGPLAHLPSGRFAANSVWALCTMITHNLLRAAGTLTSHRHARARGATLRRHLIT